MNESIEVLEPPLNEIQCKDGEMRDFGGVRIPPTIVGEIPIDYPGDVLPDVAPRFEGEPPFYLGKEGKHRVYQSTSTDGYYANKLWTVVPIEFEENIPLEYIPETDEIAPSLLYNPDENISLVERSIRGNPHLLVYEHDIDGFTETLDIDLVRFFDVPDSILLQLLPDEYNSELVSHTI